MDTISQDGKNAAGAGGVAHLSEIAPALRAILPAQVSLLVWSPDGAQPVPMAGAQWQALIVELVAEAAKNIGSESGAIAVLTDVDDFAASELEDFSTAARGVAGCHVVLAVYDTGAGDLEQLRGRFSSGALAGACEKVRGLRGVIRLECKPGRGSTVRIFLPVAAACAPPAGTASPWRGKGTILLADDEGSVLFLGKRMLEKLGFSAVAARDGREAVALFAERPGDFCAAILDLTMPDLDGLQTFHELRKLAPALPVILSSGYDREEITARVGDAGLAGFVQKPYSLGDFEKALRAALEPS